MRALVEIIILLGIVVFIVLAHGISEGTLHPVRFVRSLIWHIFDRRLYSDDDHEVTRLGLGSTMILFAWRHTRWTLIRRPCGCARYFFSWRTSLTCWKHTQEWLNRERKR